MEARQKEAPAEAQRVVSWLRNKAGMKTKVGVLGGKRVDYFKGKSAAKALQSPAYAKLKNVPKVTNEEEAANLLQSIVPFAFFLKVDRKHSISSTSSQGVKGPSMKVLEVIREQNFAPDQYYVWLVEGSQIKTVIGGVAMVAIILAGVMFPLWPTSLRIGVWYLSMATLGVIALFFGLAIFRLIFYVISWLLVKPGIWIFPNLFADVGFVDSFIPGWDWDVPPPKKKKRKTGEAKSVEGKKSKKGLAAADPATGKSTGVAASAPPSRDPNDKSARIEELSD